jgi:hypothetical protein
MYFTIRTVVDMGLQASICFYTALKLILQGLGILLLHDLLSRLLISFTAFGGISN